MEKPDCTLCGACCVGLSVFLTAEDEARLPLDELLAITRIDSEGRVRRLAQRADGSCVTLRREEGRFLCSIYERRPGACRDFEQGARRCRELREVRGLA